MTKEGFEQAWSTLRKMKGFLNKDAKDIWEWGLAEYDDKDALPGIGEYVKTNGDKEPQLVDVTDCIKRVRDKKIRDKEDKELQDMMYRRITHIPCQKCLGRGYTIQWWHDEIKRDPKDRNNEERIFYVCEKPPLDPKTGRLLDDFASEIMIPCDCEIGHRRYAGAWKERFARGVR